MERRAGKQALVNTIRGPFTRDRRPSLRQMLLESWTPTCTLMNSDADLTLLPKICSKQVRDQNVKRKTIKFPEDHRGENPDDLGRGDALLDTTPKSRFAEETMTNGAPLKVRPSALGETPSREPADEPQTRRKLVHKAHPAQHCYPKYTMNS